MTIVPTNWVTTDKGYAMSDGRDETKPEPQTNVIWLQRREQLINEYQTALSKYLIARRDAKKVSP